MCGVTAIRTDLRVSIQTRGATDRLAGHVVTGMLADSDLVLVPRPPNGLLHPVAELEILIIPVPLQVEAEIERFRAPKIVSHHVLKEPDRALIAAIRLHGRSRYSAQVRSCDSRTLSNALEEANGDLWAAMYRLELIPNGIDDISRDILLQLHDVELTQWRSRLDRHPFNSLGEVGAEVCRLICSCDPGDLRPQS